MLLWLLLMPMGVGAQGQEKEEPTTTMSRRQRYHEERERLYRDYLTHTGDSVRSPFHRSLSFHTNMVDWFLATPNASLEIDLSPKRSTRYSLLLTGKWNPATKNHTFSPRWVYNVSSVKGELRRYWRTGTAEDVSLPTIERDTTLWGPISRWSYFRRRVMSSRYVKHPRYWRAYYLGLYGAYNKFSLCLDGDGKQGNSYSFGLSAGWSVPLYKHLDGSGWDFDIGASAGVMMTAYDEYKYYRESACYVYTGTKPRFTHPMVQDLHISLVYRFRSIDNKVLYGASRFQMREELRAMRERERADSIAAKNERKRLHGIYDDINTLLGKAKAQLALYPDTTSYHYIVLAAAIDYTHKNSQELRYDSEWSFNRQVLMRHLEYYMTLTNQMAPESQRTDRLEREKQRQKEEALRRKQEAQQAKEEQRQQKEEQKKQKKEQRHAEENAAEEPPAAEETPASNAEEGGEA